MQRSFFRIFFLMGVMSQSVMADTMTIYRTMYAVDNKPKIGEQKFELGVRKGIDVKIIPDLPPPDKVRALKPGYKDEEKITKKLKSYIQGMSVTLFDPYNMNTNVLPASWGGNAMEEGLQVFKTTIDNLKPYLGNKLQLMYTSSNFFHAVIGPNSTGNPRELKYLQKQLNETQEIWTIVPPPPPPHSCNE